MKDKINRQENLNSKENGQDTSVKGRRPNVPNKVNVQFLGSKSEESYEGFRNIVKLMIMESIKRDLANKDKK